MSFSRRKILKSLAIGIPALQLSPTLAFGNNNYGVKKESVADDRFFAPGLFKPTRASLRSYEIPNWFRDAKFGIWAHWGPQSAIEAGDWYARNMYMQGHRQYKYHIDTYGHPSKVGYKDTIPLWKAEKFDPDYLLGLYKKAGAKYFMSMGVHHDNFDLWDSKYNSWNSVKMGPKKDIVGLFAKAAKKHGLKFGISDHLWITPKWFSSSKGKDTEGPLAGFHYDGADPKNFSLYGNSEQVFDKRLDWNENWITESWKKHWFDRIKDLVDKYEPDLLYSDGHLPFEEQGLTLLAHLYNQNAAKHGGKTQAVYTSKRPEDTDGETGICVYDVERGVVDNVWPRPWQTDTCIGDWHYNKSKVGKYKTAKSVIDLLIDIVSRNGNLMLNIPLPASGMPDSEELKILDGITKWMAVNSEAIYATRPWKIFGAGPQSTITKGDKGAVFDALQFNEKDRKDFSYEDTRFTTKEKTLFAFFMGWPTSTEIVIKPLSTISEQKTGLIENVELLGYGKLSFTRDYEGLKVQLPSVKPCDYAYTLKIDGVDLI